MGKHWGGFEDEKRLIRTAKSNTESTRFRRHLDLTVLMEINRSLDPDLKLARGLSILIRGAHWIPTGRDIARRRPLAPNVERTSAPGDDSSVRQHVLAGDSFNDEQRSDDLSGPLSR